MSSPVFSSDPHTYLKISWVLSHPQKPKASLTPLTLSKLLDYFLFGPDKLFLKARVVF